MKAVNIQTQFLLERIRERAKEASASGKPLPSPYGALDKGRKALGREWDEPTKRMAIEALALWVVSLVAGMLTTTMNEISAVGRAAANSDEKEHNDAARELATSMGFIENVMKMFAESIDFEYIAEQLFEDGAKAEAEEQKATTKFAEKYKPSVN